MDDNERLQFKDGDLVVFSEIKGMNEFSDGRPRKVMNVRPYTFHSHEAPSSSNLASSSSTNNLKERRLGATAMVSKS